MGPKPRTLQRELECELTDRERDQLTRKHIDLETQVDELKEERTKINAKIRPIAKESREMVRKLKSNTEMRLIRCTVHEGPGVNIRIVRDDTGETVEQRAMTDEERQLKVNGEDWLEATERAVERAKSGGDESEDGDDGSDDNVTPIGRGKGAKRKGAKRKK